MKPNCDIIRDNLNDIVNEIININYTIEEAISS